MAVHQLIAKKKRSQFTVIPAVARPPEKMIHYSGGEKTLGKKEERENERREKKESV